MVSYVFITFVLDVLLIILVFLLLLNFLLVLLVAGGGGSGDSSQTMNLRLISFWNRFNKIYPEFGFIFEFQNNQNKTIKTVSSNKLRFEQ